MIEITLLNLETGKKFIKHFSSYYLAKKFMNKVKYSKKLKLCAYFEY